MEMRQQAPTLPGVKAGASILPLAAPLAALGQQHPRAGQRPTGRTDAIGRT
jgi:hypothetical protein